MEAMQLGDILRNMYIIKIINMTILCGEFFHFLLIKIHYTFTFRDLFALNLFTRA